MLIRHGWSMLLRIEEQLNNKRMLFWKSVSLTDSQLHATLEQMV